MQKLSTVKQRTAINASARYAAILVGLITRFFLTPFLLQKLGAELLGLQTLAAQALGLAGIVSGAIGVSYRKHATESYAKNDFTGMNAYLSIGMLMSCVSAFLLLFGMAVIVWWAGQLFGLPENLVATARWVILLSGLANAGFIVLDVLTSPSFILEKMFISDISIVISTILGALGVWVVFSFFAPSLIVWVVLANGLQLAVLVLIAIPWSKKLLPQMHVFALPREKRRGLASFLNFGGLSLLSSIGYLLFYGTDSILISNMDELGISKIIYYNVAQRWDPIVRMAISALALSLTPALISRYACSDIEGAHRLLLKGTRYCLIIGILPCVVITVFAYPFLDLWLGRDFAEVSSPILQVIMSTMIISIPEIMGFEALLATGRLGVVAVATILCGICNILISISLVKIWGMGLMGVALGTVAMLIVKNGLLNPVLVSKFMKIPIRTYLRDGYRRPILALLIYVPGVLFIRNCIETTSWLGLSLACFLSVVFYLPCIWGIGFEKNDRAEVVRFITQICKNFSYKVIK